MVSTAAAYPKTRRIRFRFGDDGNAHKYFVEDDIVYSHFVA
ncbi:MAG: metal-dependent hydrolase, partial [[Mycobacterium] stephanolepidis]